MKYPYQGGYFYTKGGKIMKRSGVIAVTILMSFLLTGVVFAADGKIDINSATLKELTTLPGITEAIAQRIIEARPFEKPEELMEKVKGIGEKTYEKIKGQIVANPTKIDVNSATAETLMTLPGISETVAKGIVAARPYKKTEELMDKVKGIGEKTYEKIKDQIVANPVKKAADKTDTKPASASKADDKKTEGPIDINSATLEQLMTLPGIGEVIGQRIIDARPYAKPEELIEKVKGIGEKTYGKIKDQIVANPVK
jgi:competence protein ComEA